VPDALTVSAPGVVPWASPGAGDIHVSGILPDGFFRKADAEVPRGLVLCAVEMNRQVPSCRTLLRDTVSPVTRTVREGTSRRFSLRADIIRVLDLPGIDTAYHIHAACGRYRSGVIVVRVQGTGKGDARG
jgi:hypothetical protein